MGEIQATPLSSLQFEGKDTGHDLWETLDSYGSNKQTKNKQTPKPCCQGAPNLMEEPWALPFGECPDRLRDQNGYMEGMH